MAMTNDYESVFEQEAEANNALHGSKDSLEAIQAFLKKENLTSIKYFKNYF